MNIYVYSDESGVFDRKHNEYYVFGGVIILGEKEKELCSRKYSKVEKDIRKATGIEGEIKATTIDIKYRNKIFRSLNNCHKFACIIKENRVIDNIWKSKKDKQRYLDFAYKIAIKHAFSKMIANKVINPSEVDNIYFSVDEHTTATNGRYELGEGLEQEFKWGTYNYNYMKFFPPIFPDLKTVDLKYCNSSKPNSKLIRAADIVANKVYYCINNDKAKLGDIPNLTIKELP